MPPVQLQPSTAATECSPPSFADLAPVLDELARLAARELHHPIKIDVTGWDDGDYTALALHNYGRFAGTDVTGREVIKYVRDREAFVARYIERNVRTGDSTVLVERELARFADPLRTDQ